MTIEVCVQTMRGYDDTLALARWCEAEGVPVLAVADHYLARPDLTSAGYDQLVILGGIARETSRLQLCSLVSPLTFRHPAVHLKAGVTLDLMSGGRFTLGIGTGWMEAEHDAFGLELYPSREGFDRLEEVLEYVRAGIDGSGTGFEGRYYRLASFDPQPQPSNLRLVVGGGGKRRTPALAGRFADEFNAFPDDEESMADRIDRCLDSARTAGRDPAAILVSTAIPAAVGPDAESAASMLQRRAERMDASPAEAGAALDRLEVPYGTPDEAAGRYAAYAEAGIRRVYLQMSASSLDDITRAVAATRAAVDLATGQPD